MMQRYQNVELVTLEIISEIFLAQIILKIFILVPSYHTHFRCQKCFKRSGIGSGIHFWSDLIPMPIPKYTDFTDTNLLVHRYNLFLTHS